MWNSSVTNYGCSVGTAGGEPFSHGDWSYGSRMTSLLAVAFDYVELGYNKFKLRAASWWMRAPSTSGGEFWGNVKTDGKSTGIYAIQDWLISRDNKIGYVAFDSMRVVIIKPIMFSCGVVE